MRDIFAGVLRDDRDHPLTDLRFFALFAQASVTQGLGFAEGPPGGRQSVFCCRRRQTNRWPDGIQALRTDMRVRRAPLSIKTITRAPKSLPVSDIKP